MFGFPFCYKKVLINVLFRFLRSKCFYRRTAICGSIENHYKTEAEIVEIDGYTYTAVDVDGDEWKFEDDKLFPVGTKVKLKLFNNLTVSIEDDEIVKVKPIR